mmetsp:Transcript_91823/g.196763  ORF Transcript_91823/g.196763 Transcript_91823/m.196763 type:complete len:249 (-) Transcript_91823:83-829(-)
MTIGAVFFNHRSPLPRVPLPAGFWGFINARCSRSHSLCNELTCFAHFRCSEGCVFSGAKSLEVAPRLPVAPPQPAVVLPVVPAAGPTPGRAHDPAEGEGGGATAWSVPLLLEPTSGSCSLGLSGPLPGHAGIELGGDVGGDVGGKTRTPPLLPLFTRVFPWCKPSLLPGNHFRSRHHACRGFDPDVSPLPGKMPAPSFCTLGKEGSTDCKGCADTPRFGLPNGFVGSMPPKGATSAAAPGLPLALGGH